MMVSIAPSSRLLSMLCLQREILRLAECRRLQSGSRGQLTAFAFQLLYHGLLYLLGPPVGADGLSR